jgi:hypothetical protein
MLYSFYYYKFTFSIHRIINIIFLINSVIIFILYKRYIHKNNLNKNEILLPTKFIIKTIIILFFISLASFPGCSGDFANSREYVDIGFPLTIIQVTNVLQKNEFFLGDSEMMNSMPGYRYSHNVNSFVHDLIFNFYLLMNVFFLIIFFLKKKMNNKYLNGLKYVGWYAVIAFIINNIRFLGIDIDHFSSIIISWIIYFPFVIIATILSFLGIKPFPLLKISFVIAMCIVFLIGYYFGNNKINKIDQK